MVNSEKEAVNVLIRDAVNMFARLSVSLKVISLADKTGGECIEVSAGGGGEDRVRGKRHG